MTDREPELVLYGEDHLHAPDRDRYVADIEDREPEAILLEELGGIKGSEAERLIELYDSFGTIERARECLRSEYGDDPLPDGEQLYEAVDPDVTDYLEATYEHIREAPRAALYGLAGIDPGFGDEGPDDPDDLASTPVYDFDAGVLERLADTIDEVSDGDDTIEEMVEFYEYLAVEQDTLTRLSHEIYDHAAERRRRGEEVIVAGCDRDRAAIDIDIDSDQDGFLGPAQEAVSTLERETRQRESSMVETARNHIEQTDGTVAMIVGDGHLGYTGIESRLRFDDIDIEVHRSGQDNHRRREQLAGLVYFHTMRSETAGEASDRFAELLED